LPPGVAAQVDPDASEGELILAYCRLLIARPDLAAAMGAAARGYVAREHSLEGAAAGYIRFLAERYGWGDVRKLRDDPLWQLPTTDDRRPPGQGDKETRRQGDTVTAAANHSSFIVHRSSFHLHPSSFILHLLAEALGEIGATEEDAPLLESAARALAELLDQEG